MHDNECPSCKKWVGENPCSCTDEEIEEAENEPSTQTA